MNDDYLPLLRGIDAGGHRYFLGGRPVHAGDVLVMRGRGPCRFEWCCLPNVPPKLFLGDCEEPVAPPKDARFRWPD